MIYIYHDFGGTHTTSLAAAYHLKILQNPVKIPDKHDILAVPYFNKLTKQDAGKFIFHGKDEEGNPVYTLGKRSSKVVLPAVYNFAELMMNHYQINEKIILSNTSPLVPFAMTVGGFFSRELKVDVIGVPLLIKGAQKCWPHVCQLVEETKKIAKRSEEPIVKIENHKFQA
jgi:hypothetical protein